MHPATAFAVTALLMARALLGDVAAPGPPDLSGTWKVRTDSTRMEGRRPPQPGGFGGQETGRRPGPPPRGTQLGGLLGTGLARTLTIVQTDSTVTVAGDSGPGWTYFTDGREIQRTVSDSVAVVVRAWWDAEDLIVERKGEEGTATVAYRLDDRGPRLIVITEIRPGSEKSALRPVRTHRIYYRAAPNPAAPSPAPPAPAPPI
jgi:hypothetical protein